MAKDSNGMMLILILSQVSTVAQESPSPELGKYGSEFVGQVNKIELKIWVCKCAAQPPSNVSHTFSRLLNDL